MSRVKPAVVRYYVDADILRLGHVLAAIRSDVTYPGDPGMVIYKRERPPCPITTPAAKDPDWLPQVAQRGWLILTRDRHIQEHRREIAQVRDHGAKMIVLNGADARSVFDQLEVVMCRWRDIEKRAGEPPPFIYTATRTKLRPIPL